MKRIVVPDGMYQAALKFQDSGIQCEAALRAALEWLAENPIIPTKEQCDAIYDDSPYNDMEDYENRLSSQWAFSEWQRRMFLAPEEPMIGEETVGQFCARYQKIGDAVIEAYRRGRESRSAVTVKIP